MTSSGKSEHFRNDQPGIITVANAEKFIVLPYRKNRGNLMPGEMRQASNAVSAEKIASAMAERFVGVAAYAVIVDEETGDMTSPRLLARYGEIADLNAA
nr:hypothetical protein [Rhizobium lentis]